MTTIRDIKVVALQYDFADDQGYGTSRGLTNRRGGGLVSAGYRRWRAGHRRGVGAGRCDAGVSRPGETATIVGRSVFAQRGAAQDVLARMYHFGTQNQLVALMGGIDIAAHDAMGKLLNLSVADLIGGRLRERVPVYASGGYFTEAAAGQDAALARQLEPMAARGFAALQDQDRPASGAGCRTVRLARRIIGETPLLTVDTNGNYTEDGCWRACAAPRRTTSTGTRSRSRRRTGPATPAAIARVGPARDRRGALRSVFDFRRLIDARLAAVVQPDLTLCGGFDVARTIGVLCAAEHLRISPHVWGTGIGLAAAVQFVAPPSHCDLLRRSAFGIRFSHRARSAGAPQPLVHRRAL